MPELHKMLLRQELQKEIEEAKKLEAEGRMGEAGEHYIRASSIFRVMAYGTPKTKADEMFSLASQYEDVGKAIVRKFPKATKAPDTKADAQMDNLIVTQKPDVKWDDIGGLSGAKQEIKEAVILPFIQGKPKYVKAPRTILLYGPPGTGKTMLAKAACTNLNATFFEAKISSLLSKFFGESPKLVNALFSKARKMQPSLIFMDELDSLAVSRDSNIDEATRRVLSQLLTEIEGFSTSQEDTVIIMGATNKPWDLDDAMVSRFQKRVYVPLPDPSARKVILQIHLEGADISKVDMGDLTKKTDLFSGRDIYNLCQEAVIKMVREMNANMENLTAKELGSFTLKSRPLSNHDFESAFEKIKPSSTQAEIKRYESWKATFGG